MILRRREAKLVRSKSWKIAVMAGMANCLIGLISPPNAAASPNSRPQGWNEARSYYFYELSQLVPDYEKLNVDEGFLRWLDQPDLASGEKRQDVLTSAYTAFDVRKTAEIFNKYKEFLAAKINYPLVFPEERWELLHIKQDGSDLDGRVYVERVGRLLPDGNVEIWGATTRDFGAGIVQVKYQFHCLKHGTIEYRTTEVFLSGNGQPSLSTKALDVSWKNLDIRAVEGQYFARAIKACPR